MNASSTPPGNRSSGCTAPPGPHPGQGALDRLSAALGAWGRLIMDVGRTGDPHIVEQVIGGLVEWMGNELLDGWIHLPIAVFEAVSGLAEELFQAGQGYLAAIRGEGGALPEPDRADHEGRMRSLLDRVDALKTGIGGQGSGAGG